MPVFAWAERHPRAFLAVACLPAFVLGAFAWQQWRRAQNLGSEPARVSAEQAVERAERSGESWVELLDSRTNCDQSVVHGSRLYAHVGTPSLADSTTLIASSDEIPCSANEPLIGVLEPLNARLSRNLSNAGLAFPSDRPVWLLWRHDGPANARTMAWLLVVFAGVVVLLGCSGFAVGRSNRQTRAAQAESALPRELLLASLSRPVLRLRRSFLARMLGIGLVIGSGGGLLGVGAAFGAHEVYEIQIAEPRRWRTAAEVTSAGRVTVLREGRFVLAEDFVGSVEISWFPDGGSDLEPVRVEYHVAWFSGLEQPIVVRKDSSGYLTSAGFQLAPARTTHWILASALCLGMFSVCAWSSKSFFGQIRSLWRARRCPKLIFLPLLEVKEVRQYGMHTASTWSFGDSPDRKRRQTWPARRRPLFDESGKRVLVVVADEPQPKAPILIASEGYPFVI